MLGWYIMYRVLVLKAFLVLFSFCEIPAGMTVVFTPFEDRVHLKEEAWDLKYDLPAWFSSTIDTLGGSDSPVRVVPFDTVKALFSGGAWKAGNVLDRARIVRLCSSYGCRYLISGRIEAFRARKRAINTDASLQAEHEIGDKSTGFGGTTVMAGLHSYEASIRLTVDVYSGKSGEKVHQIILDNDRKDGGLNIWLPINSQNPEIDYYEMTRHPFGSEYFRRTILGSIMHAFSQRLHNELTKLPRIAAGEAPVHIEKEYLEGQVLEHVGNHVYINLGTNDDLFTGELLQVMRPIRPLRGEDGDTLGWVEEPTCTIKVKYIKSAHFAQAVLDSCMGFTGRLEPGWSVRSTQSPEETKWNTTPK